MLWSELLTMTNDELDALCQEAQTEAEYLPDCIEREMVESLVEAAADILEDRRVIPASWNAFYSPEDGSWSLYPAS